MLKLNAFLKEKNVRSFLKINKAKIIEYDTEWWVMADELFLSLFIRLS